MLGQSMITDLDLHKIGNNQMLSRPGTPLPSFFITLFRSHSFCLVFFSVESPTGMRSYDHRPSDYKGADEFHQQECMQFWFGDAGSPTQVCTAVASDSRLSVAVM